MNMNNLYITKNKPRKSLGQHFLINPRLSEKIVDLLDVCDNENILEIGPGAGALTSYLINKPYKNFLLLEKDKNLACRIAKSNYYTVNMDALRFDWQRLSQVGQWKIIGNLPYNIASPLIWNIFSQCLCLKKAVFMVQKEVGDRLVAMPGNKDYGALSVWTQCHVSPRIEFNVKPGSFTPPPKIESSVLSFLPLSAMPAYPQHLKLILNVFFQNRRKQLGSILKKNNWTNFFPVFEDLNIELNARPENISCQNYLALAKRFADLFFIK